MEGNGSVLRVVTDHDVPVEPHDEDEQARLVMEAMNKVADEQLERAERLREAPRQILVYVGAIFAVAQTVALSSFSQELVRGWERTGVLVAGIAAAVALLVAGFATVQADRMKTVPDIAPEDIAAKADEAAENGTHVGDGLIAPYSTLARKRAKAAEDRQGWTIFATRAATCTIVLVVVEIILSLYSRIH